MKNRAIWVALGVLAIAALLMFFVVLPQMRDNATVKTLADKAGEQLKSASETVKTAADDAAKVVTESGEALKTDALAKMARLKTETAGALSAFDTLFAAGKTPSAEEIAAAKAKLTAALKSASELKAPESLDSAVGGAMKVIADGAAKALALAEKMPTDAEGAKKALSDIKAAIGQSLGLPAEKPKDEAAVAPAEVLPAFDILRVEPTGDTVIAGRAAPGAKLEILDAGKVISSVAVGAAGDFAAVLDQPLAPGDHEIVIQATTKDGKVMTSEEVATVSVPADGKGELLAMVTKPGEASRILAMPEAKVVADNAAATTESKEVAAKAVVPSAPEAAADVAAKPDVAIVTPDLPSASSELSTTAPVVPTEAKPVETAVADPNVVVTEKATAPSVVVSAVEIEGDKIFVAGNAPSGSKLRIYADENLVGEVTANADGRFVADNVLALAVGNHTIRADLLSADASKVELRASVPFFRPEGEQLAAVADPDAKPQAPEMQPLADGAFDKAREEARKAVDLLKALYANGKVPSAEELAAARSSTEIALKTLAELKLADTVDPQVRDMAAKAAAEAASALTMLKSVPNDAEAMKAALAAIEKGVGSAVAPVVQSADAGKIAAPAEVDTASGKAVVPDTKATADDAAKAVPGSEGETTAVSESTTDAAKTPVAGETAAGAASETDTDTKPADAATGNTENADAPQVIEQAPLKHSEASVIIRRGDTLWHISRRVYGKGVRYTTIYLANKAQIADPDRIVPGQVFGVPDKPLDNAEQLHRKRLGLQ